MTGNRKNDVDELISRYCFLSLDIVLPSYLIDNIRTKLQIEHEKASKKVFASIIHRRGMTEKCCFEDRSNSKT